MPKKGISDSTSIGVMLSKVFDKVLFGSNILIIVVAFYALDSDVS